MFFESFETRQMFSVGIPTTIVTIPKPTIIASLTVNLAPATTAKATTPVKTTVSIATTPAPSQGTVIKQGTNSTLAGAVQGTTDPAKLGSTPLGTTTGTLAGGITLSADPNARPSAADLADASAFRSFFNSIANSAMQGLLAQYGKSLTDLGLTGSADPSGKIDFLGMVMKDMQAMTGVGQLGTVGGIDQRKADGDVPGGLGVNPTDAEVAAAIKAQQAKDAAAATTPAPAPAATPAKSPAKDAGETVATYLMDVVIEKFGPPGPATTILGAPGFVEKVTGDAGDLFRGFVAIFKSGDKNPDNNPKGLTSPDGDVTLEPQQQKIVNEAMAYFSKYTANQPTLHDLGTSLISQPARGGDGSVIVKPDKNQLLAGQAPHKDMSPYINPGSGDDGNTPLTGTAPTAPKAVVKDPPKPGVDTDNPGIAPPTSGVAPVSGGTTTGVKPTTPK